MFGTERLGSRSNGTGSGVTGARRRRGWINGEYIYLDADEWTGNGWAGGLVVTMAQWTEGGCGAVDVVVRCSMTMGVVVVVGGTGYLRPCSFLGGGMVVGKALLMSLPPLPLLWKDTVSASSPITHSPRLPQHPPSHRKQQPPPVPVRTPSSPQPNQHPPPGDHQPSAQGS